MKKNNGFSLIECLVAIFVIAVIILFVSNVFPYLYRGFQLSENHMYAAYLGRSLLEVARSSYFNTITPYSGNYICSGIKNSDSFSLKMDYSVGVDNIVPNEKKLVWVNIQWKEQGVKKNVTLETIIIYNP